MIRLKGRLASNPAGSQGEPQLLQEAEACAKIFCGAYVEHRNAEASTAAGSPSGAIAAAARGLEHLDSCLPQSKVGLL